MIEAIVNAMMMVTLIMPPVAAPAQYVVKSGTTVLGYSPARGWLPYAECAFDCWVPANQRTTLLSNEFSLQELCNANLVIYENGQPKVWISPIFAPTQCAIWK